MRVLALIAALWAGPLFAQPVMTNIQCQTAMDRSIVALGNFLAAILVIGDKDSVHTYVRGIQTFSTPEGWCKVGAEQGSDLAEFLLEFEWRAPDIDLLFADGTMPGRLELRLSRVNVGKAADADIEIALQHVPDQGLLLIDRAIFTAADGASISGAGVIDGAFFRTVGAAQTSFGGLRLTRFAGTANVSHQLVADLIPDLTGAALKDAISELNFSQLDRDSKLQVTLFANDLPRARGVLNVDYDSEQGLGLIQLTSALTHEGPEAVAIALSGATVTVDWQPQ